MLLLLNTQQNNDAVRPDGVGPPYDACGDRTALPRRWRRCGQRARGAPLLRLPAQEARGRGAGLKYHTQSISSIWPTITTVCVICMAAAQAKVDWLNRQPRSAEEAET